MNKIKALAFCSLLLALSLHRASAAPLLSEGFEAYNLGPLDADFAGPNAGPNGGPGTGWWSVFPPSLYVVGAETETIPGVITNHVTPHGGVQMVRGNSSNPGEFDTIFYNLAYRLTNIDGFSGDFSLDWWFFDPVGTNGTPKQYADALRLGAYPNAPTNTDYFLDPETPAGDPGSPTEWLSLGAAIIQRAGFIATNYQVQILNPGNTAGSYDVADGWFNVTNRIRSVGWHHARISVSEVNTNNNFAPVAFYIDNMVNPALTNTTEVTNNFNLIEMDSNLGNFTGYFDDISFGPPPPPIISLNIVASAGKAIVSWSGTGFTLQTSTNLAGSNFVDVLTATSPFTNTITSTPLFFRLRQ